MKKLVILIAIFCAVMMVAIFLPRRTFVKSTPSAPQKPANHDQITDTLKPAKSPNPKIETIPSTLVAPHQPKVQYSSGDFNGATTDPAAMEMLSKMKTWSDVGDVRSTAKGTQQLWLGDRMVIEAKLIKPGRTMARNGTIVVAVVAEGLESHLTEGKQISSDLPSAIWEVDVQGHATRISPPNEVAAAPLISTEGRRVAFVVSAMGTNGIPEQAHLVVFDLKTREYRSFRSKQSLDEYKVWPVEWAEGGKVLNLMEDYGETGGHIVMKQIRLE